MSAITDGTVLITGPTGGLGRIAALTLAARPAGERPDLLLVGRPGAKLDAILAEVQATGTRAEAVGADLGQLADVRAAGQQIIGLLGDGAVRPLRALVANAGLWSIDLSAASADGFEKTFAVNYLAHAQLIADLLDSFTLPGRIVLLGSNVYRGDFRRFFGVPGPQWRDPLELAKPAEPGGKRNLKASGTTYANSKLAVLYYAHELQRQVPDGLSVSVFEPGWMPGTGLGREGGAAMERIGRWLARVPGTSTPERAGPALASVAVDERWASLRDGAFVVIDKEVPVLPHGRDAAREARLTEATAELLAR